jgi:cytochrome c biogenesis protein CcdA
MTESASLALLPLIAATLILTTRFYVREGAISVLSMSFMLATLCVLMLIGYMFLWITQVLPDYAWVVFGGVGLVLSVGGIWSFFR